MSYPGSLFRALVRGNRLRALCATAAVPILATACGASPQPVAALVASRPVLHEATDATTGISSTADGFTLDSAQTTLPAAGGTYQFRILGPDGAAQTMFLEDSTKLVHFYVIRDDLTNFRHLHPTMAPTGTWSIAIPAVQPGPYHVYTDFLLQDVQGTVHHLVLQRPLLVPGVFKLAPILPAPSLTASVDGYSITFLARPKAWTVTLWPARVTYRGLPFTGVQPYLRTFSHFSAFKMSNHLFGHAHPLQYAGEGKPGPYDSAMYHAGPDLLFHAEFPGAGEYRAFVEFMAGGQLHTAALTLDVAPA